MLRPSSLINNNYEAITDELNTDAVEAISATIYSKLRILGFINSKYTSYAQPHIFFTLLQLIMIQVHPLLSIKNIVIQDIPKYSESGDIHIYTKSIVILANHHEMST